MTRPLKRQPDLEAEQEVDLGSVASTVAARWWLPLLGILLGAAMGYAFSIGGGKIYEADARLYLGNPFSPNGGATVASLATNPNVVSEIVRSEPALREAARAAGMRVGELRGRVSTSPVRDPGQRATQTNLVTITVTGSRPARTERAANALAQHVVEHPSVSGYVDAKIATYNRTLDTLQAGIDSVTQRVTTSQRALARPGLPLVEQLILISQIDNAEQRRVGLINQQTQTQQLLSLAEDVERAQVYERAAAVKTTARSTRNSVLVGAALGLLLGLAAALAWDAIAARRHA
jgi:capsular polysaccharide biosynthesis protein